MSAALLALGFDARLTVADPCEYTSVPGQEEPILRLLTAYRPSAGAPEIVLAQLHPPARWAAASPAFVVVAPADGQI
jgi:hypothetical protein